MSEDVVRRFRQLDRFLQTKGFPATSPWWHGEIERWYSRGALQFVGRIGRGGGKSSTMCRLAVCEGLYGDHDVNPGDTGVVCIVSASKDDANDRLATIRSILLALGYTPVRRGVRPGRKNFVESAEEILVPHRRVAFRVYAASFRALSGFTSIFVLLDEVAKWRDEKTGTSPAREVLASVKATRRSKPKKIALISSPLGLVDLHAELFGQGDTDDQVVAHAATWTANPSVTEADCRRQEASELLFQREYGAVPQAEDELSLFDGSLVRDCVRRMRDESEVAAPLTPADLPPDARHRYVATIDPATRGNAWTLIVAALSDSHLRRVCLAREWIGTKARPLVPGNVFRDIRQLLAPYRLRIVFSDQFSEDSLREIARQNDLVLVVDPPWSPAVKADAYEQLRTLFQERRVELPPDPQVAADVLGVRQRLTRNGLTYDLAKSGARHSDYAPAIAMALMLAKVPPTPLPKDMTDGQRSEAAMVEFLERRSRERRRSERLGRRFGRPLRKAG